MKKQKPKIKIMWRIQGLKKSPKDDRNLYSNFEKAEMFAPIPSAILKTTIIKL